MRIVIYIICGILLALPLEAQYEIKVNSEGIDPDTLLLGYFYGNKQYLQDTAALQNDRYVFNSQDTLHNGMYFLYSPQNKFIKQFIIDHQRTFDITITPDQSLNFANSLQNTAFYDYINFLGKQKRSLNAIKNSDLDSIAISDKKNKINEEVREYQNEITETYQDSILSMIIALNREIDVPEFAEAGEERKKLQYEYFIQHYFDSIDFRDDRLIYTPGFVKKVDTYLDNYIAQNPDSLINAIDRILAKTNYDGENYKFLLVNFLNSYASSKVIGMDAIYVYLVNKYYSQGKAPWVDEKQITKMKDNAQRLEPILIGKKAPNIKMKLKDGTVKPLYDIDSEYTILFFWAPDCNHCKEVIPELAEKFKNYKKYDLELYAACTKLTDKASMCWDYIDEHPEMDQFINVFDPYLDSRFKQKYDVTSTPKIFLLDKDKTIIMKRFGIEQMPEILDHYVVKEKEQRLKR